MGTRIQLVGPLAVFGDGGLVTGAPLAARRVRLVLAALATAPGGLSASALADRVWEEPPPTWSAALRGAILSLRGALDPIGLGGQELVRTVPNGWAIAPGVTVDLSDAASAVARSEQQLSDGSAESAAESVRAVVEVIGGELLSGEDAAWVVELRARWESITDRALVVDAEAAFLLARYSSAIETSRRIVERNALDERAHRVLIRSLAASGDRSGAIRAYEECRIVLADQLGTDPSPETAAVYLDVLRSGASAAGRMPPPPRNGFFGREPQLATAAAAFGEAGVVSILGRGGVGKTRFLLHAAAAATGLSGGRFWVPLGDVAESALVAVSVARAIGAEEGADPLAATIARLAPLGPALLVLDGCENALDGVAELLAVLLATAPELRVLTSSRRALDVAGERKIELVPFAVPTEDDISTNAAVRLLSDRLQSRGQTLRTDGRSAGPVIQLVARCGGVPLALELAAAQLSGMAVADLLDLLPSATHGADEVVESLLEQSFESLGDDAARLFTAWGVMDGALPLSLAARLAPGTVAPGRAARLLGELVDSGLLLIDRSGPRWRYQQDDQVRAFARTKLAGGVEGQRFALDALISGLRALLPDDPRTPPSGFRDAATEGSDAFRTVFSAALGGILSRETGLDLAFRLHRYWTVTGMAEGRYWLGLLIDGAPASPSLPFASFALGYLSYWAGDSDASQRQLEEAARLLRGVDDGYAARSLMFAAGVADDRDRPGDAIRDVTAAQQLAAGTGDVNLQISAQISVASILAERGDRDAAEYAARAVQSCRGRASEDQLLATLATASLVCWQVGAFEQARISIAEADRLLHGEPRIARATLAIAAAGVALADGRLEAAARLAEIAVHDGEELGIEHELPLFHTMAARIAIARGRSAEAATSTLAAIAQAVSLDFDYPMAVCLEAAADLAPDDADATALRAVASRIRAAGDRPAPAQFRTSSVVATPNSATSTSATSTPETITQAVERARAVLTAIGEA